MGWVADFSTTKKPNRLYAIFIGLVVAETILEVLIIKNKIPKTKKLNLLHVKVGLQVLHWRQNIIRN